MDESKITRMALDKMTAFEHLELVFSPGVNVFIGANGTGKTHILKLLYCACDVTKTDQLFTEKLIRVFLPYNRNLGRLVNRKKGSFAAKIEIYRTGDKLASGFSNHTKRPSPQDVNGNLSWNRQRMECAYIPAKDMLANAPGFRSLYAARDIHFEEIYADIIDRAYRPLLRGPMDQPRKKLLQLIERCVDGKVETKEQEFFLRNRQGNLEFTLLAEGLRKLALLWLLIQNGSLLEGSFLFWDEPEANLNPKMMKTVVEILLELQRLGVQVFLATHDYVLLKEFDLQSTQKDSVMYHALYRDQTCRAITLDSTEDYLSIHPNAIADTFQDLYDREVERSIRGVRR
jgi:hypothetical protein